MNTQTCSSSFARAAGRRRRGIALVIVLSMLVIISGLLVAFMSTALNERGVSQMNSDNTAARQLSDTTVNLAIATIREATTQPDDKASWSSQPGAIRLFSGKLGGKVSAADGAQAWSFSTGTNDFVFRLYSADRLKVRADAYEGELKDEVNIIDNWNRFKPTIGYVDLNQPVFTTPDDPKAKFVIPHYPIIDPRAKYNDKGATPNSSPNDGIVQGFDVKSDGLIDSDLRIEGGAGVPYLPMPVKWLYAFKDGSIGQVTQGTKDNPIVGRIAYWVDDETCKLNINTATEGTFWDTPSFSLLKEAGGVDGAGGLASVNQGLNLGASQPTRGEFQRYPGHPATTSLSPAMGWLWSLAPGFSTYPQNTAYRDYKEAIYRMAPFMPSGIETSMGASSNPDKYNTGNPKLLVVRKALYPSVDGMLFDMNTFDKSSGNPLYNPPVSASVQAKSPTVVTAPALEKLRFFLTAQSRSPEVNLYGRPRITFWPVNDDPKLRTSFDDLFAFTSTLGSIVTNANSKKFYLGRKEAKSQTVDYDGITRNKDMYAYLKFLTENDVPGFGGNFKDKYGDTERRQILTEIFDYCRCVNLVDTGTSRSTSGFRPYTPFYGFGANGYTDATRSYDWSGQVTPIHIDDTAGFGRFFTPSEIALDFYRAGPVQAGHQPAIQAALVMDIGTVSAGFPAIRETYWTRVTALSPASITAGANAVPLNLCSTNGQGKALINIPNVGSNDKIDGRSFMPTLGCGTAFIYYQEHSGPTDPGLYPNDPKFNKTASVTVKQFTNASPFSAAYTRNQTVKFYPYVSDLIPVAATTTTFSMTPLTLQIEIFSGESPEDGAAWKSQLVQTVNVTFPPMVNLPIPVDSATDASMGTRFPTINSGRDSADYDIFRAGDTVRAMDFVGSSGNGPLAANQQGDLRLSMAHAVVPDTAWQPRGTLATYNNASTTFRIIHGMHRGHGDALNFYWPGDSGATGNPSRGRLAANSLLHSSKVPILPASLGGTMNGVKRVDGGPGDWDRGISKHMDGAMINKVDEGNVYFEYTQGTASYRVPYYRGRGIEETGQSFFTPSRMLPSAVMFGSLSTGVVSGKPWQTLLFRPDRETGNGHPGGKIPPDHLLLDLFHLPIVEPWAISEPFSTAGKVNLNYVIAPFGYAHGNGGNNPGSTNVARSYVRRDTALRGVLKAAKITCAPTGIAQSGHTEIADSDSTTQVRFDVDLDKTLAQIEARLKDPKRGLFRSGSEICDVDLYPLGLNVPNWNTFWDTSYDQTGDNQREKPYAHIYPRVTTKSNVYTVHMRCQAIRKSPKSQPNEFDEKKDVVVSEYRGSATVERFIDPNDESLRNYDEQKDRLDPYYRFRIISTKHFAP